MPLLEVTDLRAYFHTRKGLVKAVDGVGFTLEKGETLGIVGESGSGKSVTQLTLMGLLPSPPLKVESGKAMFGDIDLLNTSDSVLRQLRGNKISMIFQEPMTSLNPYLKIGTQLIEPLTEHRNMDKKQAWDEAEKALKRVGIAHPHTAMDAYPHEFSGGMRQRVMIAMALTTKPELLIADEPTTALDVTVQAQILELLKDIQQETGMSIIFITHDLGVVAGIADKVLVMYAGKVFEYGSTDSIFYDSQHPYTRALLKSTPRLDQENEALPPIGGSPPDLSRLTGGCPFYERCQYRMDECSTIWPEPKSFADSHKSYCHLERLPG